MIILLKRDKAIFDGGRIKKGDLIIHLASNLDGDDAQREELADFIRNQELPDYIMQNDHFQGSPPRLDAWGETAKQVEKAYDRHLAERDRKAKTEIRKAVRDGFDDDLKKDV